jgi:hypothetical protein
MPRGIYKRTKKVKEIVQAPIPNVRIVTGLLDSIDKIFDNLHTPEDILLVGDAVKQFKRSDMYAVLEKVCQFVINSELDAQTKTGINNDEVVGIQKGARRILTTLSGLDRTAQIVNNQMEAQRKREEEESSEDVTNSEDIDPIKNPRGSTSI